MLAELLASWLTAFNLVQWNQVNLINLFFGGKISITPTSVAIELPSTSPQGPVTFILSGKDLSANLFTLQFAGDVLGATVTQGDQNIVVPMKIRSTPIQQAIDVITQDLNDDGAIGQASIGFLSDRLLPFVSLKSVSEKSSLRENASGTIDFVFERTGPLAKALTVTFKVGGTANLKGTNINPADYVLTGSDSTAATRTVIFAKNVQKVTVKVDPLADQRGETDENVNLQLVEKSHYVIATPAKVEGKILNDDFIGSDTKKDVFTGTVAAEFFDGRGFQDTITTGTGPDLVGFRFTHSTILAPDRIKDFAFAKDKIDLFTSSGDALIQPKTFTRASNNSNKSTFAELAAAVFKDADGKTSGDQKLAPNQAALVVSTNSKIKGTYLLINNHTQTRSNNDDLFINITGHTGTLPGLGPIEPNIVFA